MTISPIKLVFPNLQLEVEGVTQFQYHQDFAPPSISSWSFSIEDNRALKLRAAIELGTKIQIQLAGKPQVTGFVEKLSQDAGSITVSGRDILGNIASADIDPRARFRKGMTLKQLLQFVLIPLGINTVEGDDSLNLQAILGPTDDDSPPPKSEFGAIALEQLKVKEGEGVLNLIDRVLLRFGLYMWAKADGSGVVVAKPTYNNSPYHQFTRHLDGVGNTIEKGSLDRTTEGAPSIFIALGHGKGAGDEDHPRIKAYALNPLLGTDVNSQPLPGITKLLSDPNWKGIQEVKIGDLSNYRYLFGPNDTFPVRPVIVKDKNANTQKEMNESTKRRLGEMMTKILTFRYEVAGWGQHGIPFAINRMVAVDDEVIDARGTFWVKERTFTQAVNGGTNTTLSLVLPFCF